MATQPQLVKLRHAALGSRLLAKKDAVLVALSGGPDSMALLEILRGMAARQGWRLHAAHLNHRLRGRASDGDEAFVRAWTRKHGIALAFRRADVTGHARRRRVNLEAAAREIRYAFLEETARKTGCNKIATAHTADDQAETVLWRMLRGAVGGLAGIPAARPLGGGLLLIRPLLSVRKKDILAFLREQKIPYRVDASNQEAQFTRNRIRKSLIPYLEKHFNPSLVSSLNAAAQSLAKQRDVINSLTRKALSKGILKPVQAGGQCAQCLAIRPLQKLQPALRAEILKKAFEAAGGDLDRLKNEHIQQLLALCEPAKATGQWNAEGIWVLREPDRLVVREGKPPQPKTDASPARTLKIPGTTPFGNFARLETRLMNNRGNNFPWKAVQKRPAMEYFDRDRLRLPLTLRQRLPGDRYRPIGLQGTRKVKDMLIDAKIPVSQRDSHLVLEDAAGRILWVAGCRIAEFCKIRPETRKILAVRLKRR